MQLPRKSKFMYFLILSSLITSVASSIDQDTDNESTPKVYLDPDATYETVEDSPDDIYITSLISGVKPMELRWYHNGKKLQDQHNSSFLYVNNGKLLLKAPISKYHEGQYTLEARNEYGIDDETVEINVIENDVKGDNGFVAFQEELTIARNDHRESKASDIVIGCSVAIVVMIALGASLAVCKPRRIVKRTKEAKRRLLKKVKKKQGDAEEANSSGSE